MPGECDSSCGDRWFCWRPRSRCMRSARKPTPTEVSRTWRRTLGPTKQPACSSMAQSWPGGCFSRLELPPVASPPKEKHLLNVNGLAALPRLNHQTVRNWIDSGYLRAIRIGRRARTRRADFAAFSIASYTGNKSASERYPGWKRGRSGGSRAISLYRPPLGESCSLTGSRLGSRLNAGWAHHPERLKFPFSRSP